MKFNPLGEVAGKRIVVVDDSIVRGNTTRQLVQMLFDAGASEVHVRVSSPPVVSPCFYGIDMADEDQLAAAHRSVEEMRAHIGATSLHYLSVEGMQEATQLPEDRSAVRASRASTRRACLRGSRSSASSPRLPRRFSAAAGRTRSSFAGTRRSPLATATPAARSPGSRSRGRAGTGVPPGRSTRSSRSVRSWRRGLSRTSSPTRRSSWDGGTSSRDRVARSSRRSPGSRATARAGGRRRSCRRFRPPTPPRRPTRASRSSSPGRGR